jgi:hypothetical protein
VVDQGRYKPFHAEAAGSSVKNWLATSTLPNDENHRCASTREHFVKAMPEWTRSLTLLGGPWCGAVMSQLHCLDVTRFSRGCELTLDAGSAPISALEELVRVLRAFGVVSFDRAALEATAKRSHTGTRADILPLVRTEGGPLSQHLVGELWIQYAVESRNAFASLGPQDLEPLRIEPRALKRMALDNLRQRIPPVHVTGHSGRYILTLPGEGGHFEASLLLLDEVWEHQATLVKGDVVAALPARDLLFVTGTEEAQGLDQVKALMTQNVEHPLSQQLLVRRAGAWRVLARESAPLP